MEVKPVKKTFVIAGNRVHFMRWCRDNDVNPYCKEIVYVGGPAILMGRCFCPDCAEVVTLSQAALNRHLREIQARIKQIKGCGHVG